MHVGHASEIGRHIRGTIAHRDASRRRLSEHVGKRREKLIGEAVRNAFEVREVKYDMHGLASTENALRFRPQAGKRGDYARRRLILDPSRSHSDQGPYPDRICADKALRRPCAHDGRPNFPGACSEADIRGHSAGRLPLGGAPPVRCQWRPFKSRTIVQCPRRTDVGTSD